MSVLTLAGVWDRSVLTELEEEQWDPVFVSVPDKRRFLDSGELDICKIKDNVNDRSYKAQKLARCKCAVFSLHKFTSIPLQYILTKKKTKTPQ